MIYHIWREAEGALDKTTGQAVCTYHCVAVGGEDEHYDAVKELGGKLLYYFQADSWHEAMVEYDSWRRALEKKLWRAR